MIQIRDALRFNIYSPATIDGVRYPDFTDRSLWPQVGITEVETPSPPPGYLENPDWYAVTEQDSAPYVVYTRLTDEQIWAVEAGKAQAVKDNVVQQTQSRLDAFARTRNYDGILSACTYATSTVPRFQTEGQYAVNARDATWATLYQIMAEVEAGQRPMPSGFADLEQDLPALEWPA